MKFCLSLEQIIKKVATDAKRRHVGTKALGYPDYFAYTLVVAKILGVIAIVYPKTPKMIKEWAYAGFFFLMTGAIFTHFAVGDNLIEFFGPSLLLLLTIMSWYFRPDNRKLNFNL